MTGHKEADLLLSNYRSQIRSAVQESLKRSLQVADAHPDRSSTYSSVQMDKDLLDILSSEIKATLFPSVEKLLAAVDNSVNSRLAAMESKLTRIAESRRRDEAELFSRLRQLETKLQELRNVEVSASLPSSHSVSRNPYADIEACANTNDWIRAFIVSISVANGTDFLTHLLRERFPSAEDFFLQTPIPDALLAIQVCINLARELLVSDKYCAYKLEMINELVLNLVSPIPSGVSEKFSQLRDALNQLLTLIPPGIPVSSRVREILKIVAATDRLITPQSSAVSTPPAAYF